MHLYVTRAYYLALDVMQIDRMLDITATHNMLLSVMFYYYRAVNKIFVKQFK